MYDHSVYSGHRKHSGKPSHLKYPQLITVKVRAEANLNRDLLQFPLKGTALRYTWSFQSGP